MKETPAEKPKEHWNSKLGVILAVAGSAVGFGHFLRFPGLAAEYGGGAFMIAYFCSFLLLGIPLCWVEWAIGRRGGVLGGHSMPSIFMLITRSRYWKYIGIVGVLVPLSIAMFYIYLEGWVLGYAINIGMGNLQFEDSAEYGNYFSSFTGLSANGAIFNNGGSPALWFFGIAVLVNFVLLYRGISKGIEWFCKWSMPALLITAIIIMVRVLTLGTPDTAQPERSVSEGLGYMWNPSKVMITVDGKTESMLPSKASKSEQLELINRIQAQHPEAKVEQQEIKLIDGLLNPSLWLAAAGQIFFSLSVGFGTTCTYASYVRRKKDIALSSLTANAANEVIEVGVAGMMIVPAAVSFLGIAAAAGASTFGLGFNVLPQVFAAMPGGQVFGCLFFSLLFLAAVTSSISLVQPSIAFMEEFWSLSRRQSVALVIMMLGGGSFMVAWFTEGLMALDTIDFWLGSLMLFVIAMLQLIIFTRVIGTRESINELSRGSLMKLPSWLYYVFNYITPSILVTIFAAWLYKNIFVEACPQIQNIINGELGALMPLTWVALIGIFMALVARSSRRYHKHQLVEEQEEEHRVPYS